MALKNFSGGMGVNQITEGVIWKQLLYFFFPILFGTFFQQLYNTADAVIVGQFVGTEALAAVGGATASLINIIVNLFVGLASGTTVIIAQCYGANDHAHVGGAVHTSVALALTVGAVLTVAGIAASPWALRVMGTPADVMAPALQYIRVYFLGTIPSFLYNIGSGVLRAVGDTRRPLYFLITACLVNIVLDVAFVAGLGMGVLGAGLATVLSQVVSALLVLTALMRDEASYRLDWRRLRFDGPLLGRVLRVGIPAGLQNNMYAISNIIIQTVFNSFGTVTVAAWTAHGKIDGFFWMVMGAFGISITTFAGQNFGAQKYDRIRKSVRVCLAMSFGCALLMTALYWTLGQPLLGLFTRDPEVLALGLDIMHQMTPYYFTYICVEILGGAIRGCGSSIMPMLVTGGGICVFRVIWIFVVLPFWPGLHTLLLSYPVSWVLTSLLFLLYYLPGGWLRRCIRKAGFSPEMHGGKGAPAAVQK